ncbi:MAG: hypothetical protein KF729_03900 [Sandaracinaceae bacterium]|nr:hypothetical protein [Sandaracinaceae bacterium]
MISPLRLLSRTALAAVALACALGGCARGDDGTDAGYDAGPPAPRDGGEVDPDTGAPSCAGDEECDDGLACNGAERCVDGACAAGVAVRCDDEVACTIDRCEEPDATCASDPDSTRCSADERCHATDGCRPLVRCEADADCDDGAACNGAERCTPGAADADARTGCAPGAPIVCDDGIACTTDRCVNPSGTCDHVPTECPPGGSRGCITRCGSAGNQSCDAECRWQACEPPAETCNGVDDDCDGLVDQSFECAQGVAGTCTTGCGSMGTRTCDASCAWGACAPPTEVCNGLDDDCDGACDDGFACCAGTSESCVASCGTTGTRACSGGCAWGVCVPPAEVCNGLDDDCNGACDDGFACCAGSTGACTTSCGTTGSRVCSGTCAWGACAPPAEVCNGVDDDCNGTCDDGFACCAGASGSCTIGGCAGTRTCSAGCAWGACALGAAPPNDTCAGTIPTISASGTFAFGTCAASNSFTASCGGGAAAPDVVYRLSITQVSDVVLETTASTFDTVLHLRSGASCPGTELACDDDGGAGTLSRITRRLVPGTYWVVVDGSGAASQGTGTLSATLTPVVPANDQCAAAITLSGSTGTRTDTFDGASRTATDCRSGAELWYRFTVTERTVVYFDTFGSAFDTAISIRAACGTGMVECVDDACGVTQDQLVRVVTPGTYHVAVHAFSAATYVGTVALRWAFMRAASGANTRITGNGTFSGTTGGTGVMSGACAGGGPEDGWYFTRCPSASGTVTAETCTRASWDTVLYVRSGGDVELGCNDDACSTQSRVSATYGGPGVYMIVVDGFGSAAGSYSVAVTGL